MQSSSGQRTRATSKIELLEHALRQLTGISRSGWHDILASSACVRKIRDKDVWTGESDPLTLSEATLMIVRDAHYADWRVR